MQSPVSATREQIEEGLRSRPSISMPTPGAPRTPRLLIADDEGGIRMACRYMLEMDGIECDETEDGIDALEAVAATQYDVLILDVDMPRMKGPEVCRRLRTNSHSLNLKILMVSGRASPDEMAQMLMAGADDFLGKPFSAIQLQARVRAALRHKEAQDRSDRLNRELLTLNRHMESLLLARDGDLLHARDALVLALAKLAEYRDNETGTHLLRLQHYSVRLAETAAESPIFAEQIDQNFIEMLGACAPLHDIGKVGLPDSILLKPGKLEPAERLVMQTHTIIGYDTLKFVSRQYSFAGALLQTGMDIARHHHERFDGRGYPDRLVGGDIPLSARLVAICDVYDALRSNRVYKPAIPHDEVVAIMTESSEGQFDPALLREFQRCAPDLDCIYRESLDASSPAFAAVAVPRGWEPLLTP